MITWRYVPEQAHLARRVKVQALHEAAWLLLEDSLKSIITKILG